MRRVRWLAAKWPVSMRTLATRMKGQAFTSDSFDGFVVQRVRDNLIEAHYIEKLSYQETVVDPFGREAVFERIRYRTIDFTLFSEFPNIELREAHRSTREFLSKLIELCSFSVTIEPIAVDLLRWVEDIQRDIKVKSIVDSVQVSGLELEAGIHAKVLIKGDSDVRAALDRLAFAKKFELEKVQVKAKMRAGGQPVPIHISSSGTAKIPEDYWDDLLPALRLSLARQRQKG